MSRAWTRQRERGSTRALALITWIATTIGRGTGRLLLVPIVAYFLVAARGPRRGSWLYLRRLNGHPPGWREMFQHMHCFAATILDRVFLLAGRFDGLDIQVHNGPLLLRQAESGRGCILLGAHLGSFEVLRVLGVLVRRFPLKVLMNVDHNPALTRFLARLNPELAETIIPIRGPTTLLQVKECIDAGYMIGVLGDRVVSHENSIPCRFFGDDAAFPTGPMTLAAAVGAPVILAFGLYRGGNRYDVYFEWLTDAVVGRRDERRAAIDALTRRYVERLEAHARMAPYNWFNFYDFWDEDGVRRT